MHFYQIFKYSAKISSHIMQDLREPQLESCLLLVERGSAENGY